MAPDHSKKPRSSKSNWLWKKTYQKTTTRKTRSQIRKQIQKNQRSKTGLDSLFLKKVVKNIPGFLGVFPLDFLRNITFTRPACFIINLDVSSQPGSHWIAINVRASTIEIFDSLGLDPTSWYRKPLFLLLFLRKFSYSHKILISPQIQPSYSNFCGFYALFYVLFQQKFSFKKLCDYFSPDLTVNDNKLLSLFQ